jgi:GH15 family glucan-1,4-alpha-glucosidase
MRRREARLTGAPGYLPLADYAQIGDCHSAALVSRAGSIDWCCLPRFDEGSTFGRLLDAERGGHCATAPVDEAASSARRYVDRTLVIETTFRSEEGEAALFDCFLMPPAEDRGERRRILRVIEGRAGAVRFALRVAPRFDYGAIEPWLRRHRHGIHSAIGGDDSLLVWSDAALRRRVREADLVGEAVVRTGERIRLLITYLHPEKVDAGALEPPQPGELDRRLDETCAWWRRWSANVDAEGSDRPSLLRSALVLKALTYAPTGAMVAAPTTSLPEALDGARNWDYRFSWIRDAALASRSLAELGCEDEADAFRRFVERSAAGDASSLQLLYGIGGERRINEFEIEHLEGWRGRGPVRAGNDAALQTQLDARGHVVVQSLRQRRRGRPPDEDDWRFLSTLVESTIEHWHEPDAGIWEWRDKPRHFVHSKVLCWAAVEAGLALAQECRLAAPVERWRGARDEIRRAVESDGYDHRRGVFVQAFGSASLDAALLRLPVYGFVDWSDERMVRTTDAILDELLEGGLIRRHAVDDGVGGREGAFLCCSFWLAEVLANQGRRQRAREIFDRAASTANEMGLFSEEYDPRTEEMLGNYPQALTHLSHIEAALALEGARQRSL